MSITTVCASLKTILDAITAATSDGVTLNVNAYDPPPPNLDSVRWPAAYVFVGNADYSYEFGAQEMLETREYEIHVAVAAESTSNLSIREKHIRPLITATRDQLLKYPNLSTAGVYQQVPQGDSGAILLQEYGGLYVGFTLTINVSELISRTYAAGE